MGFKISSIRSSKIKLSINNLVQTRYLSRMLSSSREHTETFRYQAEVDRVLNMIVNSLYSNKDIFLRELISNASDALDKARIVSIERPEVLYKKQELEIRVKVLEATNTLV